MRHRPLLPRAGAFWYSWTRRAPSGPAGSRAAHLQGAPPVVTRHPGSELSAKFTERATGLALRSGVARVSDRPSGYDTRVDETAGDAHGAYHDRRDRLLLHLLLRGAWPVQRRLQGVGAVGGLPVRVARAQRRESARPHGAPVLAARAAGHAAQPDDVDLPISLATGR